MLTRITVRNYAFVIALSTGPARTGAADCRAVLELAVLGKRVQIYRLSKTHKRTYGCFSGVEVLSICVWYIVDSVAHSFRRATSHRSSSSKCLDAQDA